MRRAVDRNEDRARDPAHRTGTAAAERAHVAPTHSRLDRGRRDRVGARTATAWRIRHPGSSRGLGSAPAEERVAGSEPAAGWTAVLERLPAATRRWFLRFGRSARDEGDAPRARRDGTGLTWSYLGRRFSRGGAPCRVAGRSSWVPPEQGKLILVAPNCQAVETAIPGASFEIPARNHCICTRWTSRDVRCVVLD